MLVLACRYLVESLPETKIILEARQVQVRLPTQINGIPKPCIARSIELYPCRQVGHQTLSPPQQVAVLEARTDRNTQQVARSRSAVAVGVVELKVCTQRDRQTGSELNLKMQHLWIKPVCLLPDTHEGVNPQIIEFFIGFIKTSGSELNG